MQQSKSVKNLLLKKLNILDKRNKPILNCINTAFSNTSNYFSQYINGNKIIIGKSLPQSLEKHLTTRINLTSIKPSNPKNIPCTKPSIIYKPKRINNLFQSYLSTPKLSSSSLMLNSSRRNDNTSSTKLNDSDIFELFDSFKSKSNSNSKQTETHSLTNNKSIQQMLSLQEQILKNKMHVNKTQCKIQKHIFKRINRYKQKLNNNRSMLLNSINNYRILKECKNKFETNNNNNNDHSSNNINSENTAEVKWLMQLRFGDENGRKETVFNAGTPMKEKWMTLYNRLPRIEEKVRMEGDINEEKVMNYYKKMKNERDIRKVKKYVKCLDGLKVDGRNLLEAEIESMKNMKGKKRLVKFNYKEGEKSGKEFVKSYSWRDLNGRSGIVRNCMHLHEGL